MFRINPLSDYRYLETREWRLDEDAEEVALSLNGALRRTDLGGLFSSDFFIEAEYAKQGTSAALHSLAKEIFLEYKIFSRQREQLLKEKKESFSFREHQGLKMSLSTLLDLSELLEKSVEEHRQILMAQQLQLFEKRFQQSRSYDVPWKVVRQAICSTVSQLSPKFIIKLHVPSKGEKKEEQLAELIEGEIETATQVYHSRPVATAYIEGSERGFSLANIVAESLAARQGVLYDEEYREQWVRQAKDRLCRKTEAAFDLLLIAADSCNFDPMALATSNVL